MSFDLLKEFIGLIGALLSLFSALSSGKLIETTENDVSPLKWGALCFGLGAAFIAALFLLISQQQILSANTTIQWGGIIGCVAAVIGFFTTNVLKKEVAQSMLHRVYVQSPPPQVIYVRNYPPFTPDLIPVFVTGIICALVAFIAFLIFVYNSSPHYWR